MASVTPDIRVGNLMSIDPVDQSRRAGADAESLLKAYRISGLPVVDGEVTVGVISQTDIVVARSSELISGTGAAPVRNYDHPGGDGSPRDEHPASGAAHDRSAHSPPGRGRR